MYLGFKPNNLKDMKHGLQHNDIQSIGPLEKSIFLERGRLRASVRSKFTRFWRFIKIGCSAEQGGPKLL